MKKIGVFILAIIFFILFTGPTFAADLDIQCSDTSCTSSNSQALFTASDLWSPGKTESKTIHIQNISSTSKHIGITPSNNNSNGNLDRIIDLIIKQTSDNAILFSGSLNSFYNSGAIYLATLSPHETRDFTLSAIMDPSAGNEYQNLITTFDLNFGFDVTDEGGNTNNGGNNNQNGNNNNQNNDNSNQNNNDQNDNSQNNSQNNNSNTTPNNIILANAQTGGQVLGISTQSGNLNKSLSSIGDGQILGTESSSFRDPNNTAQKSIAVQCSSSWWWILILALQIVGTILLKKVKNIYNRTSYLTQICLGIIAAVILWQFFCMSWIIIASIILTLLGLRLLYKNNFLRSRT